MGLSWEYTGWSSIGNYIGIILRFYWDFKGTILGLYWDYIQQALLLAIRKVLLRSGQRRSRQPPQTLQQI